MSIQGSAGAASAAEEILNLVNKEIAEAKQNGKSDVVATLENIKRKAEFIKASADAGWY